MCPSEIGGKHMRLLPIDFMKGLDSLKLEAL